MLNPTSKEDRPFIEDNSIIEVTQKSQQSVKRISENHQKYQKYFKALDTDEVKDFISKYSHKLYQNKIIYTPNNFSAEPKILLLNQLSNKRVINLSVSLSFFTFQIVGLNAGVKSLFTTCLPRISYGGTANILYFQSSQKKNFIIKSIKTISNKAQRSGNSESLFPKSLREAIKQYCFTKLFSILQIGPKAVNQFGFDILIYVDSIEFCLQKCLNIKFVDEQSLSKDLRAMHSLRIVHGDIKCENIMWSSQYKKVVFIDFGLAKALLQKPGYATLTHYFGTFGYCSQQMELLLYKKNIDYIDLYYNDVHCLKKSADKFRFPQQVVLLNKKQSENKFQLVLEYLLNLQLMKLIFDRDLQSIHSMFRQYKLVVSDVTMQIFQELPLQKTTYRLYQILQKGRLSEGDIDIVQSLKFKGPNKLKKIKNFLFQSNQESSINQAIQITKNLDSPVTFSWLAFCLLIFLNEDITWRAKERKTELKDRLQNMETVDEQFFQLLVQYACNLYTTQSNLIQAFESSLILMKEEQNLIKKSHKRRKYLVYYYAYQIASLAIKKYSVNLYEVYQKVSQRKKNEIKQKIKTQEYYIWSHYFQTTGFDFVDMLIRKKSFEDPSLGLKQVILFKLVEVNQNYRGIENSFISFCSKFYPSSKCSLLKIDAFNKQSTIFLEKDLLTFLPYQQSLYEVSINYCLERTSALYFLLAIQIENQLIRQTSLQKLKEKTNLIKQFLTLFQTFSLIQTFTQWFLIRVSRLRQFKIFENRILVVYWLEQMYDIHREFIPTYSSAKHLLMPSHIYEIFQLYTLKNQYIGGIQITQTLEFFLEINVWADWWTGLQFPMQQILCIFHSRILLLEACGIQTKDQINKSLRSIKVLIPKMKPVLKIQVHLLFLKNLLSASDIEGCQQHLVQLQSLVQMNFHQQANRCLQAFSFEPYIHKYLSLKPLEYFQRNFTFLGYFLRIYEEMKSSLNQKQFILCLLLRNSVQYYLQSSLVIRVLQLYIEQLKSVRQKNFEEYTKFYGNSIALFEMVFTSILKIQFLQQTKNVMEALRLIVELIPFTATYIRKRFSDKYSAFALFFMQKQILETNEMKQQLWQNKRFRNSQYPLKKQEFTEFIKKTKLKKVKKYIWITLVRKLEKWNENKRIKVNCNSVNLHSNDAKFFEMVINENFPDQWVSNL